MRRQQQGCGFSTLLVVLLVMGGFGVLVWRNAQPLTPLVPFVPTQAESTQVSNAWQDVLRSGFNGSGSPIPTIAIPDPNQRFIAPTLAQETGPTPTQFAAGDVNTSGQEVFVAGVTPTLPLPTPTIPAGSTEVAIVVPTVAVRATSYPSLNIPLNRDPLGRDHYWFARPVRADSVNFGSAYYEYGTNGPKDSPYAIHTGIDIANPEGTPVLAAGDGTIVFATDLEDENQRVFENSPAYGKVVVIEHDFGFDGKPIYTLYAHLLTVLVSKGQRVKAGDPVALTGNTGHSSGPHVHFEVRVFENRFGSTYNPVLWLAPYVGHGTIAGRLVGERGEFIDDVDVQLSSGGLVRDTTTTYVFRGTGSNVNPDPNWQENFVFFDVPTGKYRVEATINGERVTQIIEVFEGVTTDVELKPNPEAVEVDAATLVTPTP